MVPILCSLSLLQLRQLTPCRDFWCNFAFDSLQCPKWGWSCSSSTEVLVKGTRSALNDCLHCWLRARLGELTGRLQQGSFIFRPHSPPLTPTLGSQLLITCARAASGANPRGQTTEVTLSTLPLVISNPHASTDSCRMPPVNYSDHSPSAAAAERMGVGAAAH